MLSQKKVDRHTTHNLGWGHCSKANVSLMLRLFCFIPRANGKVRGSHYALQVEADLVTYKARFTTRGQQGKIGNGGYPGVTGNRVHSRHMPYVIRTHQRTRLCESIT